MENIHTDIEDFKTDWDEGDYSEEVGNALTEYYNLSGRDKLSFILEIIVAFESGDILLNDKVISPRDIGIDDGYEICYKICELLK